MEIAQVGFYSTLPIVSNNNLGYELSTQQKKSSDSQRPQKREHPY
jgi:hypothetical protein